MIRKLVVLITLAATTTIVGAATPALSEAQAARLDPALAAALESGTDPVRVIVHLDAAPAAELPMPPRGVEFPKARLAAVERAVDRGVSLARESLPAGALELRHTYRLIPAFAAVVSADAIPTLAGMSGVRFIELDRTWHAHTSQGLPLIHADVAHDLGITGAGTSVAIIDSGVDYTHPTLGGGPIPNGKVVYGKDTADNDSDPMDCGDHGTAVASIAAGSPYQWSSVRKFAGGVAPDATILAYKASENLNCGSFATSDVVAALEDATLLRDTYNVVAINLSIGGGWYDGPCDNRNAAYGQAVTNAAEAGIAVAISSGNDGKKTQISSPACLTNAISVGSVYDTNIINGPQFCANDSCSQILCQDKNVPAGTPTCYSNSNYYLDVLAPSEYLTAAEAHGQTTSFGGTSGAAPYITGAMALLAQAFPGIDPSVARMLLEITGTPEEDPGNGIVRPLANLEAALSSSDAAAGEPSRVAIPNGTGAPVVSSAEIAQEGFVESVTVMVKIAHPKPDQLAVTLVSPDGTRVKLHDHGEGTTPSNVIDATFGSNGVYATYPDDRQPEESLNGFVGLQAQGTWTLEVLDDVPGSQSGVDPVLVGWALRVTTREAPEPPSGSSFFIPVAVHAGGANGTFWVSDVRVLNPSFSTTGSARLYLIPSGSDGTTDFQQTNLSLPPKSIVNLADVVASRFGQESLQGNLIFQTDDADLLATSRTYNTGGARGTYGQYIDMVRSDAGVAAGEEAAYLIQLANNGAFRTNIGFSELSGHEASVEVRLYDGETGAQIGSTGSYPVPPFSNVQVNRIFDELDAGSSANAFARITVSGQGRIAAYASVVDNGTGDAIYIPASHPMGGPVMIPITAKKAGAADTNWVTDLRVMNGGSSPAQVSLEYRPEQGTGGSAATITRTVQPGTVLALDDVLGTTFGLSDATGSLRVVPAGGVPILVTSRTYNQVGSGTYGQFIGGILQGFGPGSSAVIFHLDKSNSFRANVGIAEVSGAPVTVRYALKDSEGNTLGTGSLSLDAYQVKQLNDIYAEVGAAAAENTRLDLYHDGGSGSFTAYGSVVDNGSGDAIYIPAKGL